MFYVTWGFHVKSGHASSVIEPLMLLSNPWRLTLLFVISGCATRFMLDKMSTGRFLGSRTVRLLVPLVFCMFVIVPPQTYMEIIEKLGFTGSYGDFYGKYATASGGWGIVTPTWNHLWFVAYLFVYTLLIAAIGPLMKAHPRPRRALAGQRPACHRHSVRLASANAPHTRADLRRNARPCSTTGMRTRSTFPAFLFGYAIAKHEAFFETCQRIRWPMLAIALAAWAALQFGRVAMGSFIQSDEAMITLIGVSLRELQAWTMILALFGFARKHLRHDNAARRYLTDAIFPFYIIHQTTIVVAGHYLNQLGWPVWIEAPVLIALTVASCWLGYEIVRRIGFLRPLFGLKLEPKPNPVQARTA